MTSDSQAASGPPASGEVTVILKLSFKPGTRDKVLEGVVPAAHPTRAEAGNDQFDVFKVVGSADEVVIFERWKSKAALEAHWNLSHAKQAVALLQENLVVTILKRAEGDPFGRFAWIAVLRGAMRDAG